MQEGNTPGLVSSYPERFTRHIPLPYWLTLLLLWEIIFLADYLLSLSVPGGHDHIQVFGLMTLFFASLSIGTIYCSHVLHRLYPNLLLFIDEPVDTVFQFYHVELKKCYAGIWPLLAGAACALFAFLSFKNFIIELSPDSGPVITLRMIYISVGFFYLGVALWALVMAIRIPMLFTKYKIKVSIHQFAGNGLQALGNSFFKMSFSIAMTFFVVVVTVIASPYSKNLVVLIWLAVAAMLIFGFFLFPQMGIHKIMAREKNQRMQAFAGHLEEAMEKSLNNPSSENMQRLKELFELQQHLKSMNEWPFDVNSVWQLVSALIIPLALAALEIIFN